MARGKRQNRGQDLRYNLTITLEEAYNGRAAEIKVPTQVACDTCTGSGVEPGHSAETRRLISVIAGIGRGSSPGSSAAPTGPMGMGGGMGGGGCCGGSCGCASR